MRCPACGSEVAHTGFVDDSHTNHSAAVYECKDCGWDNIPR
jgi:predicted RNA-binding Zn-ribbon protein involved in translation (DUF1610 family)